MEHLKNLDLSDLLDLLIEQTAHHTQLISIGGTPEEFRVSREILRSLQTEIQTRKEIINSPPNINTSQDQLSS
ncbi:MAG: hypothetical protein H7X88_13155 [Gloeobacteraceae cyanobacterium ES-bin-316]|nr:hypothetical protein [Ferruginibacter sp.]